MTKCYRVGHKEGISLEPKDSKDRIRIHSSRTALLNTRTEPHLQIIQYSAKIKQRSLNTVAHHPPDDRE